MSDQGRKCINLQLGCNYNSIIITLLLILEKPYLQIYVKIRTCVELKIKCINFELEYEYYNSGKEAIKKIQKSIP